MMGDKKSDVGCRMTDEKRTGDGRPIWSKH